MPHVWQYFFMLPGSILPLLWQAVGFWQYHMVVWHNDCPPVLVQLPTGSHQELCCSAPVPRFLSLSLLRDTLKGSLPLWDTVTTHFIQGLWGPVAHSDDLFCLNFSSFASPAQNPCLPWTLPKLLWWESLMIPTVTLPVTSLEYTLLPRITLSPQHPTD